MFISDNFIIAKNNIKKKITNVYNILIYFRNIFNQPIPINIFFANLFKLILSIPLTIKIAIITTSLLTTVRTINFVGNPKLVFDCQTTIPRYKRQVMIIIKLTMKMLTSTKTKTAQIKIIVQPCIKT